MARSAPLKGFARLKQFLKMRSRIKKSPARGANSCETQSETVCFLVCGKLPPGLPGEPIQLPLAFPSSGFRELDFLGDAEGIVQPLPDFGFFLPFLLSPLTVESVFHRFIPQRTQPNGLPVEALVESGL